MYGPTNFRLAQADVGRLLIASGVMEEPLRTNHPPRRVHSRPSSGARAPTTAELTSSPAIERSGNAHTLSNPLDGDSGMDVRLINATIKTIADAPEATGGVKVALETSKVATWKYVEGAVSPISGFRAVRSEESCCEFHRIASRGLRAGSAEWHSSWTIPIPLTRPGSGRQGSG